MDEVVANFSGKAYIVVDYGKMSKHHRGEYPYRDSRPMCKQPLILTR